MKKSEKPNIENKVVIAEVAKRTGLPYTATYAAITTYMEIIKECIASGVEVKMGELGTMSWKIKPPHEGVVYYNFSTGEDMPPKDVPGFLVPIFRPRRKWRTELRQLTEFWEKENEEKEDG